MVFLDGNIDTKIVKWEGDGKGRGGIKMGGSGFRRASPSPPASRRRWS